MTDDNKGSSADSAASSSAADMKNQTAKMAQDEAFARIKILEAENKAQADTIADLTQQLTEVNKVIEDQENAKLMAYILPRSTYKMEDLVGKSNAELKEKADAVDRAIPPKVNSVRFGMMGADLSDRERGLTVGDLSIVTAQKRAGKA